MTFRLADPDAVYETAVTISVPASGGPEEREFTAHFRLPAPAAVRAAALEGDPQFMLCVLAGWDGIEGHDGKPLDFSPANVEKLAGIAYFARGVAAAFERFSLGLPGKTPARSAGGSSLAAAATTDRKTRGRSAST